MHVRSAVFAAGLIFVLSQAAHAATPEAAYRKEIAQNAIQNCNAVKGFKDLMPNVRAKLCNCYAQRFSKSLTAMEILSAYMNAGSKNKTNDAVLEKKGMAALNACILNGK